MRLPFGLGAYKGRSRTTNALELLNMMVEIDQSGGAEVSLFGRPGLKEWTDIGVASEVRGIIPVDDNVYTVVGNTVYKIDKSKTKTTVGTITTDTGNVCMLNNGVQIFFVDDAEGYTITLQNDALEKITTVSFEGTKKATYIDGYGVAIQPDSGQFQISALYDFQTWNALDYATAESYPDDLVSIISDHSDLWLFGTVSTEVWYNSGGSDFPFTRKFTIEAGCRAENSVVKLDNTVFWLTDSGQLARGSGYTPAIISTRNIEYKWSQYNDMSDAIAMSCTFEGHPLYIITFKSAGKTWVYDIASAQWYEWDSWKTPGAERYRFRANNMFQFDNMILAGDYENGKIYELKSDYYSDDGYLFPTVWTSLYVDSDKRRLPHTRLEVVAETGAGYVDYQISDDARITLDANNDPTLITSGSWSKPQIMMQYSDNDGRTWSNERWAFIGETARHPARTIYRRLGSSRKRIYKFKKTDATKTVIEEILLNGS